MAATVITFLLHRLGLFVVSLVVLSMGFSGETTIPPFSELIDDFSLAVEQVSEVQLTKQVRQSSTMSMMRSEKNPFIWLAKWACHWTGFSEVFVVIILSNIFFLLFLAELMGLLTRMVTSDIATTAAILVVLWPTSFEMSLGASYAFTCFCAAASVRLALDNQWLLAGLSAAALTLSDSIFVGFVPLLIFIFWYFQRHFRVLLLIKRAAFLLLPIIFAIVWGGIELSSVKNVVLNSAFFNLFDSFGRDFSWTFSDSVVGQTVSLIVFGVGAVTAVVNNSVLLHRVVPIVFFIAVTLFSPYAELASRMPLAGICLEGFAVGSRSLSKFVQIVFVLLGIHEVYRVFA